MACLGGSEEGMLSNQEHEGNFWGDGNALHLALGSGDSVYIHQINFIKQILKIGMFCHVLIIPQFFTFYFGKLIKFIYKVI